MNVKQATAGTAALVAALALGIEPSRAATDSAGVGDASGRPKVCLVLSGGGARGAAHIGVIKVLEELRVPIDCIAGTSMGAIVGGAYASGMTVAEMEKLVAGISTETIVNEKPPRAEQDIRRKLDDRSILFGLEIGVRGDELLLPKGVVSGIQLETVLRRLARLSGFRRFDELPIPYRAVATDLVTGKAVVFGEGELANVMRASMSVPGAIAPAVIDDHMLVDGGLTNNLPVDVARAMGADIVIAVNLGTPLMKREELTSVVGVTAQMINILTEQNVQASLASLKPTDVLIAPALGDFSASDFDHLVEAVPIGEAAGRAAAARLSTLALPAERYAALRERQQRTPPVATAPVDEVRFKPMSRVNVETARASLRVKPGEPLDPDVLDADMRRLYGSGDFEHVNYRVIEQAGRRVLEVDAVEKSWGPNYLRFGLSLGSDFEGDAFFNVAASHRRTWMNALGGEWRSDAQIGRTNRLYTEFYQPLEPTQRWFFVPSAEIGLRTIDLFEGSQRIARYDASAAQASLEFGMTLAAYGEARVGYTFGKARATLDTGPPDLFPTSGTERRAGITARLVIDRLDSATFPRTGSAFATNLFASVKALGAERDYAKWDADAVTHWSTGPHTVQLGFKAGGPFGSRALPVTELIQWGGLLQQSGYPMGALLGEQLLYGRVVYYYKLREMVPVLKGLYAGASLEVGRMDRPLVPGSPTGVLASGALFAGMDTPVGPLYLGYGHAVDGSNAAYLFLGRP